MTPWRDHIRSDPAIMGGKPVVRDTRITVEFLLNLLAGGWDESKIIAEYPFLKSEHVRAAAAFAAEMVDEERHVAIARAKAA